MRRGTIWAFILVKRTNLSCHISGWLHITRQEHLRLREKSLITFIAFSHSLNLIIKVSQAYKAQLVGLLGHFSLGHTWGQRLWGWQEWSFPWFPDEAGMTNVSALIMGHGAQSILSQFSYRASTCLLYILGFLVRSD